MKIIKANRSKYTFTKNNIEKQGKILFQNKNLKKVKKTILHLKNGLIKVVF